LLVPLVEEGWIDHPVTEQVAHIYIDEVFRNGAGGADVLVLGCTHYPLLRTMLRRVVPAHVQIVDSAESTAQAVAGRLQVSATGGAGAGKVRCFATDSVEKFRRLGGRFLGRPIEDIELIDIET
jgi:glutamate racemase